MVLENYTRISDSFVQQRVMLAASWLRPAFIRYQAIDLEAKASRQNAVKLDIKDINNML